jgi:Secretion system C-terminal sorting domain/SprB repeat
MTKIKIKSYICALLLVFTTVILQAQVTAVLTPPTGCEANGMIQLTEIKGEGPFTIDWTEVVDNDDPTSINSGTIEIPLDQWNNQEVIKELKAGTYCVTIKNAKCCEAKQCFELKSKEGSVKVIYKRNNTFCVIYGGDTGKSLPAPCEGEIEIGGINDPTSWVFEWRMVEEPWREWDTQNLKDLCNGTYTLTATNKETGCVEKLRVEICCCHQAGLLSPEPGNNSASVHPDPPFNPELKVCVSSGKAGALMVDYKATPPSAKGKSDGSITLQVTGGSKDPIYYKWEEKKTKKTFTTKDIFNLPSGDYCYTVTNGCDEKTDCVPLYVCEERPMKATATFIKPCDSYIKSNPKNASGAIDIQVTGGIAPYKYKWSNGTTFSYISGVSSGNYSVTVTDKGGCTIVESYILQQGNVLKDANSNPCGFYVFCENKQRPVFFEKVSTIDIVDPSDCRQILVVCPSTGKTIGTKANPNPGLSNFNITDNCRVTAECPNGSVVTIGFQNFNTQVLGGTENGCSNCFFCLRVDFCTNEFNQVTKVIKKIKFTPQSGQLVNFGCPNTNCGIEAKCDNTVVGIICLSPDFCLKGGTIGAKISLETNTTIGDFFLSQFKNEDSPFKKDDVLLLPKGVSAYTTLSEFEHITNELTQKLEKGVPYEELNLRDYVPTECEKIECRYKLTDSEGKEIGGFLTNKVNKNPTEIRVYPNPTEDVLNIEIPLKEFPKANIEITNSLGQTIYSKECSEYSNIQIDMSRLLKGAYNIRLTDCNRNSIYNKIIIKE